MKIDFQAVNNSLLANYLSVLQRWFPNGKKVGGNFVVGSLSGEAGGSLKVDLQRGIWKDFSEESVCGADPISLYAAMHSLSQFQAAKELAENHAVAPVVVAPKKKSEDDDFEPVLNPPEDMPSPQVQDYPIRYTYKNAEGNVLGFICRSDEGGKKKIRPRTPWYDSMGNIVWRWKGFTCPRPLYGLEHLTANPYAVVLVVEGEKCADAYRAIDSTTPTITWPGGTSCVEQADWEPLRNRRVILWPDADEVGGKAMQKLAEILVEKNCEVKIVKLSNPDQNGWDVADAISQGWKHAAIIALLSQAERFVKAGQVVARTITTTQAVRTVDTEAVQRIEVREELAESKPDLDAYGFLRGAQGKYVPSLDGVCRVLEKHPRWAGKIWYDTFLEKVQTDAFGETENWTDFLAGKLNRWIQALFEFPTLGTERVHEAAQIVARSATRNCLKAWLESLQWDLTPRLHEVLSTGFGAAANLYTVRVGECWLISMVARALSPGCKVDTMPVFEGSQGTGKSSALAILGGDYFGECHEDFGSKDFVLSLKGRWLIEVAEMHAFRRADVDRLKGIMSTRVDRVRVPYGRVTEEHPRQSVFAGTTNRDDWQADDTGARRFWPVRCGFLSPQWLKEHREQIFAEAVYRFKLGEDWWDVPLVQAKVETEERRPEDPWEEVIAQYVEEHRTYSARELLVNPLLIDLEKHSNAAAKRVGAILRRLGWSNYVARVGDTTVKRWRKVSDVS